MTVYDFFFFFFQAEDGIRNIGVTGVQTCALPIYVINVRGEIHVSTAPEFSERLNEAIARGKTAVVLDLSGVEFKIGRASCRGKSVDLGGRRIIKKKKQTK